MPENSSSSSDIRRSAPVVAVVGANGFLGAKLMRALSRDGAEVRGFTSAAPAVRGTRLDPELRHADVVFYLASRMSPATANRDPACAEEEVTRFRAFLDAMQENRRRPVVTLAASGGTVYDPRCDPPYHERSPVNPSTVYGRAKLAQEEALAAATSWLSPVILRFSNVYGPGQRTDAGYGVIGHWMKALLGGERLRLIGHGATSRDYVHVSDAVDAMRATVGRASLHRAHRPTVLNIGAGSPTSLDDLYLQFKATVEPAVPAVERSAARPFDRRDVWLDVRRAAKVLGWRPRIGLAEGLADTWRHHRGATGGPADPAHQHAGA